MFGDCRWVAQPDAAFVRTMDQQVRCSSDTVRWALVVSTPAAFAAIELRGYCKQWRGGVPFMSMEAAAGSVTGDRPAPSPHTYHRTVVLLTLPGPVIGGSPPNGSYARPLLHYRLQPLPTLPSGSRPRAVSSAAAGRKPLVRILGEAT